MVTDPVAGSADRAAGPGRSSAGGAPAGSRATNRLPVQDVVASVVDPELPMLTIVDLGVVRDVAADGDAVTVTITPTYSGCPATEVIAGGVRAALEDAGLGPVAIETRFAPAWTTDWITPEGRERLRAYGIAPPGSCASEAAASNVQTVRLLARNVACPRCGSAQSERLSAFGSTACKSLYRCVACREPFEHFKPI